MAFEKGVRFYTYGEAIIPVSFPEDRTVCQWCRFCRSEDKLHRFRCLLTDEYILYPFDGVGEKCPIVLKEENLPF